MVRGRKKNASMAGGHKPREKTSWGRAGFFLKNSHKKAVAGHSTKKRKKNFRGGGGGMG